MTFLLLENLSFNSVVFVFREKNYLSFSLYYETTEKKLTLALESLHRQLLKPQMNIVNRI